MNTQISDYTWPSDLDAAQTALEFASTPSEPGPRWWWSRRKAYREGFRAGQRDAGDWILRAIQREKT